MAERRIELTKEAWKTCTDKPSAKLMVTLEEASPGDLIVIVGEEDFAPSSMVMRIVSRWPLVRLSTLIAMATLTP